MNTQHRGKLVLGYVAVIAGCVVALRLIAALMFGSLVTFWMLLPYVVFGALAAYLIYIGKRAITAAKGQPQSKPRFGWGRMVFGASFLLSFANERFHLVPTQNAVPLLEPSSPEQAAVMELTSYIVMLACVGLIVSGIWKGIRRPATH